MAQLISVYRCGVCEKSSAVMHGSAAPFCCAVVMQWKQTREYKPELHGWETGERTAAIGFRHTSPWEIPVQDAHGQQLKMESLRDIRKLEAESAKLAADGAGQEMRFRAFNNDTVNGGMLTNSFGDPPHRTPQLYDKQGRQKISFALVDSEPVEEMGPGAEESRASALPLAPGL